MPELPEAEVVAGQLRSSILGGTLKGWWLGRPDIVRQGLPMLDWFKDARVVSIERRGKSVVLEFRQSSESRYLVAELGMTGLLLLRPPHPKYHKHAHLVLSLEGAREPQVWYWNPRRFGRIHLLDLEGFERFTSRKFGHDPLGVEWRAFREEVGKRRGRLKPLLMHQQVFAGIGNIYANEILFRSRLHPHRKADRLRTAAVRRLFEAMRFVLDDAIKAGGSSVRDFLAPDGARGGYQERHLVYNKAGLPCPTGCGRRIRRLKGDRTSFYCPTCQPCPRRNTVKP